MTVADIERQVLPCQRHILQRLLQRRDTVDQGPLIDVRRRLMHGIQHTVRHDRRSRNGEVVAAGCKGHYGVSFGGYG